LAPVLRAENEEGGFQPVAFFTAENVCERSEQGVVMGLQKDLATRMEAAGASVDLQSAECSNCTCRMAAPGETLMEVYSMNQCPQVQVPLRKQRKSFFINPSTPGLSLVQSQVERRAGAIMQSISAIAGTQQERRPHSHRLLQHGPLEQEQETRKTSMFSLQQQRGRSCALFLIATSDTSANTITVEEVMGGLSAEWRQGRGWLSEPKSTPIRR
jgi:hypothetical protein